MKASGGTEAAKQAAGEAAAEAVEDGMVVGLGSGSTAAYAIRAIGEHVNAGLDIQGVPTSFQSRRLAKNVGIPLLALEDVTRIDLAIDGADQVADGQLIKGGGAAHTREKIVDTTAQRFLVVVDETKLASTLSHPVPIEVLAIARMTVADRLAALGGDPTLRDGTNKDGPVVTDNGHLVIDCDFGTIEEPAKLGTELSGLPGVLEHGLFVDLADTIYVGTADGVERRESGSPDQ
ncbi:MAG: ribose-5-phosphate isomerase RpiA [Halobacteriales archaeon]|nr:ribose-5-phosphate isomerase RpiA [Halobacteriales archaeon]